MTKLSASEMRNVNGGGTTYCPYCNKKFKDTKFLWFLIESGERKLGAHVWRCMLKSH